MRSVIAGIALLAGSIIIGTGARHADYNTGTIMMGVGCVIALAGFFFWMKGSDE